MDKEINIREECCDIYNKLKDKTEIIDYLYIAKIQIIELQKQLEEKEKLIERLQGVIDKLRDKKFAGKTLVEAVNAVFEPLFKNKCDEVEELKQQLKSQPKEIIDEIKKQMDARKLEYKTMENSFHIRGLRIDRIFEILDEILKEYQK